MKNYKFKHKNGDTIEEITFRIKINGTPLNLTGAAIEMTWKPVTGGEAVLTKSLGTGLTIVDAVNGTFKLDKQVLQVTTPKTYSYKIRITIGGVVKTYITGQTTFISDMGTV